MQTAPSPRAAPVIAGLTILMLGAMAVAIPAAPIEAKTRAHRGLVLGFAQLSEEIAEGLAADGYSHVAVDLTGARLGETRPLWTRQVERITARRFPVWGWVETRGGLEGAETVVKELNLAGVYVCGDGAGQFAAALRSRRPGLDIRTVVPPAEAASAPAGSGIVCSSGEFPGEAGRLAVLFADRLTFAEMEAARERATGDYLIVRVPVGE